MTVAGVLVTGAVAKELSAELDEISLRKAYARWAPVYDLVFGAVFERGRMAAIAAAEAVGGRILEVGVGTGISLPDYRRSNRLIGVDLSEPMLRKAQERVVNEALDHVDGVAVMDARRLGFPDAFFDVVVAQYVITVVPDPEATLDEFARVARPGGEIILVNHIGAEAGLRRGDETLALGLLARELACTTHRLGLFPRRSFRRLFVKPSLLHFPENAFTLHLLLQNSESLVDVVVAYENLQRMFLSSVAHDVRPLPRRSRDNSEE